MKKGFTIVEMIAVIAILAILSAIGLQTFSSAQRKGRDARRKSDVELIRGALEQFRSNNSTYPNYSTGPLPASICDVLPCNTTNTYLQTVPSDPLPPQHYWYYRNSPNDYYLCTLLTTPPTPVSNCGAVACDCSSAGGAQACNYCLGPYGQR